jgi:ribulose-5-phosphate 4-epimerase/fuculose-1-phosphate aldolase
MHELQRKWHAEIEQIVAVGHRLAERNYLASHGGNMSWRVSDSEILITPTKVAKARLVFDDIVVLSHDGHVRFAAEGRSPTGETPLHLRLLTKRPDLRVILHAHPPVLTGLALAHSDLLAKPYLQELVVELGPVATIPYVEPVSEALAEAFDDLSRYANVFLMHNHGVTIGSHESMDRAMDFADMLEAAAQSLVVALQCGGPVELSEDDVRGLDDVRGRRNLPLPGVPGAHADLLSAYRTVAARSRAGA